MHDPFVILLLAIGCVLWSAYVLYWAFWPRDEGIERDAMPRLRDDVPDVTYRGKR